MTILPPFSPCPHCGLQVRVHLIEQGIKDQGPAPAEIIVEPRPKPIAALRAKEAPGSPDVYILSLFWHLHYPQCEKMQAQGIGRKSFETLGPIMVQRLGNCIGLPITKDFDLAVEDPEGLPLPPFQLIKKAPEAKA
jgi:hypothetical protein